MLCGSIQCFVWMKVMSNNDQSLILNSVAVSSWWQWQSSAEDDAFRHLWASFTPRVVSSHKSLLSFFHKVFYRLLQINIFPELFHLLFAQSMLRGNHDVFCKSDTHLRNLFILLLGCTVYRNHVSFCQFLGVEGCYACDLTTDIGVFAVWLCSICFDRRTLYWSRRPKMAFAVIEIIQSYGISCATMLSGSYACHETRPTTI